MLTGPGMITLKVLVVLLALGVAACCAYGMARIEPQLVGSGVDLLDSIQVTSSQGVLHCCWCSCADSPTNTVLFGLGFVPSSQVTCACMPCRACMAEPGLDFPAAYVPCRH